MNDNDDSPRNEDTQPATGFNFGQDAGASILGGGNEATGNGGANDESRNLSSRIAQLEHDLQTQRVEAGRLRKAMEENKALREENAKLKAASKDYLSMIPENLRENLDSEQAKTIGAMIAAQIEEAKNSARERERARDEENSRFRAEDFERRLEKARPGFMKSIRAGGDKYDAWMNWTRTYGASVRQAYSACDLDGLCDLIDTFLSRNGVQPRSGADATGTPRPTSVAVPPGSAGGGNGKVYTFAEYSAAMRDAGEKVRSRAITPDAYRAIMDELAKARDEGRVTM